MVTTCCMSDGSAATIGRDYVCSNPIGQNPPLLIKPARPNSSIQDNMFLKLMLVHKTTATRRVCKENKEFGHTLNYSRKGFVIVV